MIDFVEGDTESKVKYQLIDQSGSILDLTGATVEFRFRNSSGLFSRTMTILNPASDGEVEYQFGSTELLKGLMRTSVRVTLSTGKVLSSKDPITYLVRPSV